MSTQTCWRCISRLSLSASSTSKPTPHPRTPRTAAFFSTTPIFSASNQGKSPGAPQRGKRTLRLSKNKRDTSRKKPESGERNALKKRIVLSNTNALEVRGLQDLSTENYDDENLVGTVVGLPGSIVDSLRAVEAFKVKQGWGFFRRPATLVRKETMELAKFMQEVDSAERKETARKLVVGERGSGKSVLLLQAQAMSFLNGWVVIHIPEAQDLTNAHTSYSPLPDTVPSKYVQKTYISHLLSFVSKANEPLLSTLTLSPSHNHNLPIPIQSNISLTRLADLGARDPDIAWPIFQALWTELTTPSHLALQPRPPILYSVDGLPHISRLSEYLTPNMHYIHSYDLAIVDHFISYLSGRLSLPNGGLILGVDTNSNRPTSPALDLAIAQSELQSRSPSTDISTLPLHDSLSPFDRIDTQVLAALRTASVTRLSGFSKEEVRTMLEYYAKSGMLRESVTERLVSEKWTLAGGGVVGELERGTLEGVVGA